MFDDTDDRYATERDELRRLLGSDQAWAAARRTTLNAHYTGAEVVQAMWRTAQALGFTEGRVLEPGCGSGNFIGFAPDGVEVVGVELDPTTAAVADHLYGASARIHAGGFEDFAEPDGAFDLVVGNVPFGEPRAFEPTCVRSRRTFTGPGWHRPEPAFQRTRSLVWDGRRRRPGGATVSVPARLAADAEKADLPAGSDERFAGYGVMGLPFASGHVLAMRRFPASSIGPAYTSVWHREPDGRWVFWQDQPDDQSCPRYFSAALRESRRVDIELSWPADSTLRVAVPEVDLVWTADLAATAVTRVLNAVGSAMPDRAWRARPVLTAMGPIAGFALRAGKVGMVGTSPNGQEFIANPLRVWVVNESSARLGDDDFGPTGPLSEQTRLGDFWIPQRGIFAIGRTFFGTANGTA